jgi:hypothetical protein
MKQLHKHSAEVALNQSGGWFGLKIKHTCKGVLEAQPYALPLRRWLGGKIIEIEIKISEQL